MIWHGNKQRILGKKTIGILGTTKSIIDSGLSHAHVSHK